MDPDESKHRPYRPPRSQLADPGSRNNQRPSRLLIAAAIETFTAFCFAFAAPGTINQFEELFKGFGADLDSSTRFFLSTPWLWWLFALLALGILIWIGARSDVGDAERRRMRFALWSFGVVFGVTTAWAVHAMYAPIFKLGAAV